jgi:hypothetical protein
MKRAMLACALALPLAGCFAAAAPPVDPGAGNPTGIIRIVQNLAQAYCNFIPNAGTILDLIATGDLNLQSPEGISQAVCSVVTARPKMIKTKAGAVVPAAPSIRGIVITGRRV